MNAEIKKKISKNWFKVLQNSICKEIELIENKNKIFKSKTWLRGKKKK